MMYLFPRRVGRQLDGQAVLGGVAVAEEVVA